MGTQEVAWVTPAPKYADWEAMPLRDYIAMRKLVDAHPAGSPTLEIELLLFLYGLEDAPLHALPALRSGVVQFFSPPQLIENLVEFDFGGRQWRVDREPREITVLQFSHIERYCHQYPDPLDQMLPCIALVCYPSEDPAYTIQRIGRVADALEFPTPIALSLHAFFLGHWLALNEATQLCMAMAERLEAAATALAALPTE